MIRRRGWSTRRDRGRGGRRDGFVLVESLATLTIAALLMGAMAGLIALMLRAGDRTAAVSQQIEVAGHAMAAIERDVRFAARARWAGDARTSFVFTGRPDRLLIVRDLPTPDGPRQATAIAYQSAAVEGGGRTVRAEAPLPPGALGPDALAFGADTEIYAGRQVLRFAYFDVQEDGSGEVLTDVWTPSNRLPTAVRIAVVDPATDAILDSLRVPLLIDAEPGCAQLGKSFCSHADKDQNPQGNAPSADGETGDAVDANPVGRPGGPGFRRPP